MRTLIFEREEFIAEAANHNGGIAHPETGEALLRDICNCRDGDEF